MSRTDRCDIAVVGGGPVGVVAALALHQAGFSVQLVEQGGPPPPFDPTQYDSRVYAVAASSAGLLERLGVWPTIAAARISPYHQMQVWARAAELGLLFDAADGGQAALGWIVEQELIRTAAWQRLGDVPVRTGVQVLAVQLPEAGGDDTHGVLQLGNGEQLRARLVVAADGADSPLREQAGIETVTWRYAQRAIVAQLTLAEAPAGRAFQRFLETGPLAFLPLADGRHSIVWSADTARAAELLALDDRAFAAALAEASQHALGEVTALGARSAFPLRLLHARDYHRAGLVLVGDAAHAIHPLAGQGANLGFADVAELVTVLAAARDAGRDWASARALSAYSRARKAANLEMLALTDGLYRGFGSALPGLRNVLGLGLETVNRIAPIKALLARHAAAGTG